MVDWESLAEKPGFIYRVLDGKIHLWSILPVEERDGRYVMKFYASERFPKRFAKNSKKLYKVVRDKMKHYKGIDADYGTSKLDEEADIIYDYGQVPVITAPAKQMGRYMLSFREYNELDGFMDKYYGVFKSKCEGAQFKQDFFRNHFWKVYWEKFDEGKGRAKAILIGTFGRFSKLIDYNNKVLEQLTKAVKVDVVGAKRMFWSRFWKAIKDNKDESKAQAEAFFYTLGHYTVKSTDKTMSSVVNNYVKDKVGRLTRHGSEKRAISTLAVLLAISRLPDRSTLGTVDVSDRADEIFRREWNRLGL